MIAFLSVLGGILSTVLVFALGVFTIKNTNKAKLATDQLAAKTEQNTHDTNILRVESESYERARRMDAEVVERMRQELARLEALVVSLRRELDQEREITKHQRDTMREMQETIDSLRNLIAETQVPASERAGEVS